MPPQETFGHSQQVWVSLLWGSLLLSPQSWCALGSLCTLPESVSPVLCKFWWLCGGVNGDLLQEGLCHIQVYCTQSPCPLLRRHPNTVLPQFLWGLWVLVCTCMFEPSEHLWWVWGLILNVLLPLLPSCWGFSALGCRVSPHSCSSADLNQTEIRDCWCGLYHSASQNRVKNGDIKE